MRHVYSNKDTSVLSQGADAYADESPFILAGATVLRTGGDRRGGGGAVGRQVALMLQADRCARRAQSGSDSSRFSCFLGPAGSSSAPGTSQGLKTAFAPAALLITARKLLFYIFLYSPDYKRAADTVGESDGTDKRQLSIKTPSLSTLSGGFSYFGKWKRIYLAHGRNQVF